MTLTAKAGFTLAGVAEDFFTVAGVTTDTNPASSGVITAVFPATDNNAPVAVGDAYSTNEDTQLVATVSCGVLANDTDPESDPLTAILVADVSHGSLILAADGSFTYDPDADWNGTDSFTYKANDGTADSNAVTVDITVVDVLVSVSGGIDPITGEPTGTSLDRWLDLPEEERPVVADLMLQAIFEIGESISGRTYLYDEAGELVRDQYLRVRLLQLVPDEDGIMQAIATSVSVFVVFNEQSMSYQYDLSTCGEAAGTCLQEGYYILQIACSEAVMEQVLIQLVEPTEE
ncbi:MAG: hypothetical protein E4H08_08740 [Candidatus Atribacteria bacterium]|nr:MAG: hypothetical protein E4H08_08740 [Candidatus Atribacteria bacterium]